MRKIVLLFLIGIALAVAFGGPLLSGALFLLLPVANAAEPIALTADYEPLHKGAIDLATGLYTRENEDLVVPGAPALILRRTYLSRYRVSKEFGIGATHPGEEYLIGDGERFQWASLILASGARIDFRRVSFGTSLRNAMYVHDQTPTDWSGARLGWTGIGWALRKRDGSLSLYQGCGPTTQCSILFARDAAGQTIRYRRNPNGRVQTMSTSGGRWIAFEYDAHGRVIRASASTQQEVRYIYDGRGRLERAVSSDGTLRRYTYTDVDELKTIDEPDASIENAYEHGRCVRQVNHDPDGEPLRFTFAYALEGERIVRTDMTRSDGHWTRYVWTNKYATHETRGFGNLSAEFTYDRDPRTNQVKALTVTCPDRKGLPLRHTAVVKPGDEERVKSNILQTHCYWRTPPQQPPSR